MSLTKHGVGEVLTEPGENTTKTASKEWSEDDAKALTEENTKADKEEK